MKSSKFWIAVVAAGVVANVFDYVVHGMILQNAYYSKMTDLMNQGGNPTWFVVGDFIAVLVLAWVYDKVYGTFGGGPKGGAMFGLYAGVLVNFPAGIFFHLMFKGFPYSLSWVWIILGIIFYVIVGAVLGAMYKKGEPAPAS